MAQQPLQTSSQSAEGTRELYYLAVSKKDALPPVSKTAAANSPGSQQHGRPGNTGAVHLGLRYNLVMVDPDTNKNISTVDPDRMLHKGDCFRLAMEANRSGYVYVMAKQSSGKWVPLLPSPDMVDESNIIEPGPGGKVYVPANYCFEVKDPPGTETLKVVLSRDPQDFYELYQGLKNERQPSTRPTRSPANGSAANYADVSQAMERMSQQFGTRDIAIRKVNVPASSDELPNSVYAVNTSDRPATTLVVTIEVRHR